MGDRAEFRSVWACFESGRAVTLDDVAMIGEVTQETVAGFLTGLIRNGFVAVTGIRTAGSGEALPVFKIRKRAHQPPYEAVECEPEKPKSSTDLPTLKGWLRAVAREFDGEFTRPELMAGIPESVRLSVRRTQLKNAFANLRHYQCFERTETGLVYHEPAQFQRIMDFFVSRAGVVVSERDVNFILCEKVGRTAIRQALDILATTGWDVEIQLGKVTEYKATRRNDV